MKSLQRRYRIIISKNSFWGSYYCFYEAVRLQGFSRRTIHRWFGKLVDKDDYDRKDKRTILKHLEATSKLPEEGTKEGPKRP